MTALTQLQFDRRARIEVFNGTERLEVSDLRIRITIVKTLLGYPNRGTVEVYNLADESVQRITKKFSTIRVFAGYAGSVKQIYEADVFNFFKSRQSPDSVFTFITSSGSRSWEQSVFSRSYRKGTSVQTILEEVAGSFDGTQIGSIQINPEWSPLLKNATLSGGSASIMNNLSRTYNFDWFVDQNELHVVPRGMALNDKGIYDLSVDNGLIGSPTLTELGCDFRMLMNPDVLPGRLLRMTSEFVQLGQAGLEFRRVRTIADGVYKVMETRLVNDTRGSDWYGDIIGWRQGDEPRKE